MNEVMISSSYTVRWKHPHFVSKKAFWIIFDVLEITVLFFYFILTAGSVFLCLGWISISLGELFLI